MAMLRLNSTVVGGVVGVANAALVGWSVEQYVVYGLETANRYHLAVSGQRSAWRWRKVSTCELLPDY